MNTKDGEKMSAPSEKNRYMYGVAPAMVTLMKQDQSVDTDAMRKLTDFLIEKGVHCLYPLGTTGEMFKLSCEERKLVAETVIDQAAGRVPVYIHIGAFSLKEVVELAVHARASGAAGVGAVTPAYFPNTKKELMGYFGAICEAVPEDFPVYLYNIPQLAVNDLTLDIVEELAQAYRNIVGIKYSFNDFRRTSAYTRIRGGDFSVMHGADVLLPATISLGCDGTITGCGVPYPEVYVGLYNAIIAKDDEKVRVFQAFADDYANVLKNGSNMAFFKAALVHRGLIDEYQMRAPNLVLTKEEEEVLFKELSELDAKYAKVDPDFT